MLKEFEYNGQTISFDIDGETFINATEMAKPFGKDPYSFLRNANTKAYMTILDRSANLRSVKTIAGGSNQGTWMHEKLALKFAAWLSPEFELWCFDRIEELLKNGSTTIKFLSPAEQLLQSAQMLVAQEKKLSEHDNRLNELEAKTTTRPDYFTVAGYGTLIGCPVNVKLASSLGKQAAIICKDRKIPIDKIPDTRFGLVNSYPKTILQEVFSKQVN